MPSPGPSYAATICTFVDRRAKWVATQAVSRSTRPRPTRLAAGPMASATQPNPDIPTMAAAIEPVLKVVNTRPMRCDGVISCRSAHTTGLRTAAPAPTRSRIPLQ